MAAREADAGDHAGLVVEGLARRGRVERGVVVRDDDVAHGPPVPVDAVRRGRGADDAREQVLGVAEGEPRYAELLLDVEVQRGDARARVRGDERRRVDLAEAEPRAALRRRAAAAATRRGRGAAP